MPQNKFPVVLFLSFLIVYALHFYIYNLPFADDFFYASVPDNVSALSSAISDYYTWSSRVFSNFLYVSFARGLDFTFYRVVTFSSVILFFFVVTFVTSRMIAKYSLIDKTIIILLFFVSWIYGLASPNNAIFWLGGITNYLIPLTILILCSFLLFVVFNVENMFFRWTFAVAIFLAIFVSSFSNEAILLSFLVLHLIFAVIFTYNKSSIRVLFYLSVVVFIIVLLFVINAPGNTIRMNPDGNNDGGRLLWSIWKSLMTTLERGFETYFVSMLIPASIFAYLTVCKKSIPLIINRLSLKQHSLLFFAIGILTAWAAHFSIAYALGSTGLPPRAKMIPQTFNMFFFGLANIYFLRAFEFEKIIDKYKIIRIFTVMYLIIAPCFSAEYLASLLTLGEHREYVKMYMERFEYFEKGNGFEGYDEVTVEKFPIAPAPIAATNLSADCFYHANQNTARYFKIKACLRLNEGFDGDASKANTFISNVQYQFSNGIKNYLNRWQSK